MKKSFVIGTQYLKRVNLCDIAFTSDDTNVVAEVNLMVRVDVLRLL